MHRLSRVARSAGVLAVGVGLLGLVYWYVTPHDEPLPPPPPAPSAPTASQSAAPPPAPIARGCRVLSIDGRALVTSIGRARGEDAGADAPRLLSVSEPLDGDTWVELEQPGFAVPRLVVKAARSGRESAFAYSGVFRPCIDDLDAWLVRGRFRTLGGGDAPGTDQWVVTPLGALRVAGTLTAAAFKKGDAPHVELRIEQGSPSIWLAAGADAAIEPFEPQSEGDAAAPAPAPRAADGGTDAGARPKPPAPETLARIEGPALVSVSGKELGPKDVLASVVACERESKAAGAAAARLQSGGPLDGADVTAHMQRRVSARAACAVAELRLALVPPRAEAVDAGATLAARVAEAKKLAFTGAAADAGRAP